jgi:hypothetical protein
LVRVRIAKHGGQPDQLTFRRGGGICDGHGIIDTGICVYYQFHPCPIAQSAQDAKQPQQEKYGSHCDVHRFAYRTAQSIPELKSGDSIPKCIL